VTTAGMLRGATAPGHRTAASCHRRRACKKNGQQQRTVVRGRDPGLRWLRRKVGEIHCTTWIWSFHRPRLNPAYTPELNPTEGLWSSLKAVELANLVSPTLAEVIDQAHRGIDRVRRTPHLAYSFLRHAGLSVS
jgi:hypothetical protein